MRLFGRPRKRAVTFGQAFESYFRFMEGTGPTSFTFSPGDYSQDDVASLVSAIIEVQTDYMRDEPWPRRLEAWQRERRRLREQRAGIPPCPLTASSRPSS